MNRVSVVRLSQHADGNGAGELLETAFQYLDTIEECTRQQKLIADDVLDISRLAAGRMQLHLAATDLSALFATLTTMFGSAMHLRGLKLSTHIQRARVRADQQRLLQVLGTSVCTGDAMTLSSKLICSRMR